MTAPKYVPSGQLELAALPHPNPLVQRAGFDLTHPYLEHCWTPLLGPSAVCLLRRMPALWRQGEPASIHVDDLARSLGLGAANARRATFARTVDRLVQSHFAEWRVPAQSLDVFTQVPPVPDRRLHKLPDWSARAHGQLLSSHLDGLARQTSLDRPPPTPTASAANMTARLDRLSRTSGTTVPALDR